MMPFPFHIRVFPSPYLCVLTQARVGILHSLNQHFLRQHFPMAGTGNCFLERKLTSLLTILSATSSVLTFLNASLLPPSFPHHLVQATSIATYGSLCPSPPLPNLLPMQRARQEAPGPFPQRPGRALRGAALLKAQPGLVQAKFS